MKIEKKDVVLIAIMGIAILLLVPIASAIKNSDIVSVAVSHNSQYVGLECKPFVQHVVIGTGGSLGAGYTQAYLNIGTEIQSSQAMWGDIIQLSKNTDPEEFYEGMHTAIVLKNNKDGTFAVIDSN